jgi:2-oxoglutarate dehydrogenase E2 component (dihydrolipoamide succinyltransferase)
MSVEITVPPLGESIVEATVGRWMKSSGDQVNQGEPLVELETDKVNMEVAAPESGVLQDVVAPEGTTVAVGAVLGHLDASQMAETPTEQAAPVAVQAAPSSPVSSPGENGSGRATPVARRMAEEHGIDLAQVRGSGPGGRVRQEDVAALLQSRNTVGVPAPSGTPPTPVSAPPSLGSTTSTPISTEPRREERVRMSRRRQTIANRLVEAQHTAAMLTTFNEVDMTAIMDVRKRRRDSFKERHGVGLGYMSFFTKAVVGALKAQPRLNAEIQGDEMILKYYYDIGVAVSTEGGLVVPVVHDADRLSFAEIERQIADLATRARDGSLTLAELQGGTFTITNGGIFGSLLSTPILNYPQVGILGMHKIQERPVAVDGQVLIRPMMYVALSYDHRIVDGSEAVRFLVRVKELLEDPESLLLEG